MNVMDKEEFLQLLSRKLLDGLPPTDEKRFRAMVTTNEKYQRQADIITRYFHATPRPTMTNRVKLAAIWNTIEASEASDPINQYVDNRKVTTRKKTNHWASVAAVFLIGISIGYVVYRFVFPLIVQPTFTEIQTDQDKQFLTLEDGTLIALSPASTLQYNTDFGARERVIHLRGAAYFEVAQNPKIPLLLNAGPFSIEVKGTTFQVEAYEGAPKASVKLIEGTVDVSGNGNWSQESGPPIRMKPLQKLELSLNGDSSVQLLPLSKDSLISELGEWTNQDTLAFQNVPLEVILRKLAKKFRVKIIMRNLKLNDQRFSGSLSNDIKLEGALQLLGLGYPFKYRIEPDNLVVIE